MEHEESARPKAQAVLLRHAGRFAVAWTLVIAVGVMLDSEIGFAFGFPFLTFVAGAIPQWLLLRRFLPEAGWFWLVATPLGALAATILVWICLVMGASSQSELFKDPVWLTGSYALVGGMAGAVVGIGQWLPLRMSLGPPAGRWIGVSALAGAFFLGALVASQDLRLANQGLLVKLLFPLALGVIYGGITAAGLLWLLGQSSPVEGDSALQSNS